ncbi:MAG: efflux RND transporter periplasmic adaptor subunit [Bacteroidales bacterium]|jgi:membrane fusion protein (multidrug efflux system)|nr:efflux RND transporter periplasmic adaptor subunit [Bacteroidales bacterium]
MKLKTIIIIAIVLAFAVAIIYKVVASDSSRNKGGNFVRPAVMVNLQVMKPEKFTETLSVIGSVEANEEVVLKSEVSGKITGIHFTEGTQVEKGTLLIKVYDDDLQAQLLKARANLRLTADVEARQRQLLEKEAISRQEYDVAYANLQSAQADISLLESQISKTEIVAPFDGKIGFRKISPGEYITPGTDIASLVSDNPVKIQFAVPEKYVGTIGKNSVIKYTIEGMLSERTATVYAVESMIDAATRTLQMKALTPNNDKLLTPGAFVRINVLMETKKNILMVPSDAVLSESVGQKIFVYRGGNVESVLVQTGTRTNDKIEILTGLSEGDSLITSGLMQITPRSVVKPAKVQ